MRTTNPRRRRRARKFKFTVRFPFDSKIENNNALTTATTPIRCIVIMEMEGTGQVNGVCRLTIKSSTY